MNNKRTPQPKSNLSLNGRLAMQSTNINQRPALPNVMTTSNNSTSNNLQPMIQNNRGTAAPTTKVTSSSQYSKQNQQLQSQQKITLNVLKVGQSILMAIVANNESRFIESLKFIINDQKALIQLANNIRMPTKDNPMHLAVLKYINNPFYLQYLLNSQMPLNVENESGCPPQFTLASYTDDKLFETLIIEFIKHRPSEFDLNYRSKITNQTLFDLVMLKCPSYHKLKIFIDFGYDFQREHALADKVITMLNKTYYEQCKQEERVKIVETVIDITDVKRWLEFLKIIQAIKGKHEDKKNQIDHAISRLTEGKIREIIKYI